ncbi:hypothetical protein [Caloranaerobacter ferrireducens]|uniref:hypothetical protein n=1 Tax=Caloranaerobacter ferrireducens TaxID=1323370 RepID=UPI00084CECDD|nr:hypothetical protein [Caloranaerobacter ferrireducens]
MKVFKFEVVIGKNNEIHFITTTANKITTKKLIIQWYLFKKIFSKEICLEDFFEKKGYLLKDFSNNNGLIYKMLKENKYEVIDLTNIDMYILNLFHTN